MVLFILVTAGCGISEKAEVKKSAEKFIKAFYENNFEQAKDVIYIEGSGDEQVIKNGFQAASNIVNKLMLFGQAMTGIQPTVKYEVKDISLVNGTQARIVYVLGTDTSDEKTEVNTTLIKSDGVWKVHFTSFFTSLMLE